ncbi:hypothetical protein V8C37DRAFT_268740 [Trichoderma ceciliae]
MDLDFPPNSPQEQLQSQMRLGSSPTAHMRSEASLLYLPGLAPNSSLSAFTGRAPALHHGGPNASHDMPYMFNNRYDSPPQQRRALSQTTLAPPMHRNMSNRSEPSMPAHGPRAPFLALDGRRISHERLAVAPLPRVCENPPTLPDVGVTPDAFIASYLSSTGTNLSPRDMFANDTLSAPPSMISASSVAEAPHPMTRENSYVYTSPGINMERMGSFTSHAAEPPFGQGPSDLQQPDSSWKNSDLDNALFAIGDGFSFTPSRQYAALENQALLSPTSAFMEREDSTVSFKSTRSTASCVERRAKEARERVLQASQATSIAPMPQMLPRTKAAPPVVYGRRIVQEGNKTKQRPRPPKLQCPQCSEYPEGFRGDHELRRHVSAKHVDVVKKYICRDPAEAGVYTELKVLYPLSRCKACASGKQYGAYYNAAAHLRRTHFRFRPSRGRAGVSVGERRGGKGGGDWPPMAQLKAWFEEILVRGDGSGSLGTGDDSPDEDCLSLDAEEEVQASNTHLDNNADPYVCDDVYASLSDHEFASNDMPMSYVDQSGQAAVGLGVMSELGDNDIDIDIDIAIDMSASSQGSVASSAFQNMGNLSFDSFDDLWRYDTMTPI